MSNSNKTYFKSDRILNYARKKAIKAAHIPEIIKKNYKISIKDGYVVLTSKKQKEQKMKKNYVEWLISKKTLKILKQTGWTIKWEIKKSKSNK